MRVLVCGGHNFNDTAKVYRELNAIHEKTPITCIIEGGAHGADAIGHMWGMTTEGVSISRFNADWKTYGKRAGPVRNQQMLDDGQPHLVLAFPSPDSRGTYDMIDRAKKAGVEVRVYD